MPTNLLKIYPQLLDLGHLSEQARTESLKGIFKRDIQDNADFNFRTKKIRPIKDDKPAMETLFDHLIEEEVEREINGKMVKSRIFEMDRSRRLHWIEYHVSEKKTTEMEIFSIEERIKGVDVIRTYIFDKTEKYVIVLEPQRSATDYYLITAYYINRIEGKKTMVKRLKRKLPDIY